MTAVLDDGGGRAKDLRESFEAFRREIDEYNDRRERLIKVSRDVTTASKRLIFQLHRYPHSAFVQSSQQEGAAARLVKDAVAKRDEVIVTILKAAQDEGLCGSEWSEDQKESSAARAQRHDRAYGPGLEEFVSCGPVSAEKHVPDDYPDRGGNLPAFLADRRTGHVTCTGARSTPKLITA